MNPPDPEPMMSLDKFIEQTGLSPTALVYKQPAGNDNRRIHRDPRASN
jgi:hypothetical protein